MFKNYLLIAFRNLTRYKGFSFINIAGLTIGITGCLLIGLFVWDEKQYDRFHKDGNRTFRIYSERSDDQGKSNLALTSPVFSTVLKNEFPEVENTLRMMNLYEKQLFEAGDKKIYEDHGLYSEKDFFSFFSIPVIEGNPAEALNDINGVVISKELSVKYFGTTESLGKTLRINKMDFTVQAVMEVPEKFHLHASYVLPMAHAFRNLDPKRLENWVWQQFFTYVKLKEHADRQTVQQKFAAIIKQRAHPVTKENGFTYLPYFQSLPEIHLGSAGFNWDIIKAGNKTYVNALSWIAVFVLGIACFNFINLSTARSMRRAREVGVRKVSGARKNQLVVQFTSESVILALLAVILSVAITFITIPWLNNFTGKDMRFSPFTDMVLLLCLLGGAILTGILAGLYPAFLLSGFRPVKVLKGSGFQGVQGRSVLMRKALVVLQFTLTVVLIISAFIVYRQVNYMQKKDLGFSREQLVFFPMRGDRMFSEYETFKSEILKTPGVKNATIGYGLPGDLVSGDEILVPGNNGNQSYPARQFMVDYDYLTTLQLRLLAGRDFSKEFSTDKDEAFIINETAVRELGLGSPEKAIGKELRWNIWGAKKDSLKTGRIIGVVKDFHFEDMHQKINTAVLQIFPQAYWKVALRINGQYVNETMESLTKVWTAFSPEYPMDYHFLDDNFEKMYRSEEKLSSLLWIFTMMAIFIGCLGLFGLSAFTAEQRIREIGIRKVLGATTSNLVTLLSADFIRLVLIASVIAIPLSWWAMNSWLDNFAYRTDLRIWIFFGGSLAAILIALFTVSFQAIKAALMNPAKTLRSE